MLKTVEDPISSVEKSLQFLQMNSQKPNLEGPSEKCIVIGEPGSGKSTLINFLGSRGCTQTTIELHQGDMEQTSRPMYYVVEDVQLFEFIEFGNLADFDQYMVKALTLDQVLRRTSRVKILLVVESDSIFIKEDSFTVFCQYLGKILPNYSTIKYSVGLVITKVNPITKTQVIFRQVTNLLKRELRQHLHHPSRDSEIKYQLLKHNLDLATRMNWELYSDRYNNKMVGLFKNLLEVDSLGTCIKVKTPKFVSIFRQHNEANLVSGILSVDKMQIKEMLLNMDYTQTPICMDLSYPLWESHKDHVANIITFVKSRLWTLSSILFEHYDLTISNCSNVFELKRAIHFEKELFSAMVPNAQDMFNFIISNLTDLLEEPTSHAQMFKPFVDDHLKSFKDVLTFLQGSETMFHDFEFKNISYDFERYFEKWSTFLSFLLAVEKLVATGVNLEEIFAFDYSSGWIVNETNFLNFLEKTIDLGVNVTVDDFPAVEDLLLKHLNDLLARKLRISLPDVKRDFRKTIVSTKFLLVMGPVASGKSSLIQCLTGTLPNQIRPENNVALTVTHNGVQYIECPNWIEATNFLDRLEILLLLEDLLMIMSSFKILFVIDSSRSDMADWLLLALRFLNNFVTYKKAIGFVVTNSASDQCDKFVKKISTDLQMGDLSDSEWDYLRQVFTKTRNQYDYVAFSQQKQVERVVAKLEFIKPNFGDLDYTVVLKIEIAWMFLIRALDQHYIAVLGKPFDLYDTHDELKQINKKVKTFIDMSTATERASMSQFVSSLMALAKIDPEICEQYRVLISEYGYSCMLNSLRVQFYDLAQKRELDIRACGIAYSSTMNMVTLLVDVDQFLSEYKAQTNKQRFAFSGIDSTNVLEFLNQVSDFANFGQFCFELLNFYDTNLIDNLQAIYSRTILSKTSTKIHKPQKKMMIRGNFVVCSEIGKSVLEQAKEVTIFATDTVFVDENVNSQLKLKKVTIVAPKVEIRVEPIGIVNCFVACQTLNCDQKILTNWFGPLNFDQVASFETKDVRDFSKFGIHARINAYKDFACAEMVPTNKTLKFDKFLSESLSHYVTEEFMELNYLDQLFYQPQTTHTNRFWYQKLYADLIGYKATNARLDNSNSRICKESQLLALSKINSFHDRSIESKLVTNLEDQCQKIKHNLRQISKMSAEDALLHIKRKLNRKFTASIETSHNNLDRCAAELNIHGKIINFKQVSDQIPMLVTQHFMNEVVRIIHESLKAVEMALNIALLLTDHRQQTDQTKRLVLDLTIFCNKHIVQFESNNNQRLNGQLEILTQAGIDLTDNEADAAIRQNLQNEMDSIKEDLQNLSIPEQECPQKQGARIIQELSKNDKLHVVKKRYLVFGVLEHLDAACENDVAKIEQVYESIQPFLEDFKELSVLIHQVRTVVLEMFEHFSVVYMDPINFDLNPRTSNLAQAFRKLKKFVLSFTTKFYLHKFQFSLLGHAEVAVHRWDQTFKHFKNYRTHCQVRRLFRKTVESNLLKPYNRAVVFPYKLDIQIKADLLLKEYNRSVVVFENFVFPFANKCIPQLKVPIYNKNSQNEKHNLVTKLLDAFIDNIRWLRLMTEHKSSPILQMLQQRLTKYNFTPQSAQKLFEWRHEEHFGEIFQLLKGDKVFFTADIQRGFNTRDVVKFSNLELAFRARDASKQAIIDLHLKRSSIKMRHSGRSYYKLNDQIFVITTVDQQMIYSNERSATGQTSSANSVVRTLRKCEPILSPFTTWKFQVLLNHKRSDFLTLFTQRVKIDLLLVGSCCFLDKENLVENSAGDCYLSLDEELL